MCSPAALDTVYPCAGGLRRIVQQGTIVESTLPVDDADMVPGEMSQNTYAVTGLFLIEKTHITADIIGIEDLHMIQI
jgi:hypothetical protein